MNFELYQVTLGIAVLTPAAEIYTGAFLFLGFAIGLGRLRHPAQVVPAPGRFDPGGRGREPLLRPHSPKKSP